MHNPIKLSWFIFETVTRVTKVRGYNVGQRYVSGVNRKGYKSGHMEYRDGLLSDNVIAMVGFSVERFWP